MCIYVNHSSTKIYKAKPTLKTQVWQRVGNILFKVNMMHHILVTVVYKGIKKQLMDDIHGNSPIIIKHNSTQLKVFYFTLQHC